MEPAVVVKPQEVTKAKPVETKKVVTPAQEQWDDSAESSGGDWNEIKAKKQVSKP